jgi:hypothetical protein
MLHVAHFLFKFVNTTIFDKKYKYQLQYSIDLSGYCISHYRIGEKSKHDMIIKFNFRLKRKPEFMTTKKYRPGGSGFSKLSEGDGITCPAGILNNQTKGSQGF